MTTSRAFAFLFFLTIVTPAQANDIASPEYSHAIADWISITPPPNEPQAESVVFFYAANYSDLDWTVVLKDGKVQAAANDDDKEFFGFIRFRKDVRHKVSDGHLVATNSGEFGAELTWTGNLGFSSYKISEHHVVDFFEIDSEVYALEGLTHMGALRGSLIQIARPSEDDKWEATTKLTLPSAPYTGTLSADGTLYAVLADALIAIEDTNRIVPLSSDNKWAGLYPNSAVLSPDGGSLYIGMRQFVGKFDFASKSFTFLLPHESFLNKLPAKTEENLRKKYGG